MRGANAVSQSRYDQQGVLEERLQGRLLGEHRIEEGLRRVLLIVGPTVQVADDLQRTLECTAALSQTVAVVTFPVVRQSLSVLGIGDRELRLLEQGQGGFDGEGV